MSTPSGIINIVPISPYPAWQIQQTVDVWSVMSSLAGLGYTCTQQVSPDQSGGTDYQMTISHPGYPTLTARLGDWIVLDAQQAYVYTNDEAVARFKPA